jgi:hypothetical protein
MIFFGTQIFIVLPPSFVPDHLRLFSRNTILVIQYPYIENKPPLFLELTIAAIFSHQWLLRVILDFSRKITGLHVLNFE